MESELDLNETLSMLRIYTEMDIEAPVLYERMADEVDLRFNELNS